MEIFKTTCDCGELIECEIGANGGFIENENFSLWGPFALCGKCDSEMTASYEETMKLLEGDLMDND